jgi:hypothetical protein
MYIKLFVFKLSRKFKSEQALFLFFQGSFARQLISNEIISTTRHGIELPTVASLVSGGTSWANVHGKKTNQKALARF